MSLVCSEKWTNNYSIVNVGRQRVSDIWAATLNAHLAVSYASWEQTAAEHQWTAVTAGRLLTLQQFVEVWRGRCRQSLVCDETNLVYWIRCCIGNHYFTTDLELLPFTTVSGVLYPPIISLRWSVTNYRCHACALLVDNILSTPLYLAIVSDEVRQRRSVTGHEIFTLQHSLHSHTPL